jgi:uncharacterized membrane protein
MERGNEQQSFGFCSLQPSDREFGWWFEGGAGNTNGGEIGYWLNVPIWVFVVALSIFIVMFRSNRNRVSRVVKKLERA